MLPLVAVTALGVGGAWAAAAPASTFLQPTLASKGDGRQTFLGGGLTYGTVKKGSLTIRDKSVLFDAVKTVSGGKGQPTPDGLGTVWKVTKNNVLTFKVQGSNYQLAMTGTTTLNGLDVYGKMTFVGKGRYWLGTSPSAVWSASALKLGPRAATRRQELPRLSHAAE